MDRDRVLKLAELSKITLSDAEAESFSAEISGVLGMIDLIKEFEPEAIFTADNSADFEELRADDARYDLQTAEKIREEKNGGFTAPKVVR